MSVTGAERYKPTEYTLNNYMPIPEAGCWIWMGGMNEGGYGVVSRETGFKMAHRLFYTYHKGDIPPDKLVLHKCDVRRCCNPDHLYIGDYKQNVKDMYERGRHNHPTGVRHGCAKLTEQAVREIRSLWPSVSQKELAKRFGVNQSTISGVTNGETWREVE